MGVQSTVLVADVSDSESLPRLVAQAWRLWGGIDLWVNNAGVDLLTGDNAKLPYHDKLQALLETDVRGTVLLSRDVGERMTRASGGVILNIGWDQADRGMEGASGELFAVAKNAIMGFTR
ncbi:MAG: SDR family NAD(P)-dependent oxidoreductase, partial [Planctomycetota bacterium]|nr:SDR family NAD(P)-dependent oxidoreductase [Planctomycetota bacterium]